MGAPWKESRTGFPVGSNGRAKKARAVPSIMGLSGFYPPDPIKRKPTAFFEGSIGSKLTARIF
jgi:hypothetical protein